MKYSYQAMVKAVKKHTYTKLMEVFQKAREYSQLSSVITQKKYHEKPVSNLYDEKNVKPSMIKPKIKNYNITLIQQQIIYLHICISALSSWKIGNYK